MKKTLAIPPALVRPLLLAVALLFTALGSWWTYRGVDAWSGRGGGVDAVAERDRLVKQFAQRTDELRAQFETVIADPQAQADIAAAALDDAGKRLQALWPALTTVAVYEGTLDSVYAEGGGKVGFGRLAVLSAAVAEGATAAQLVGRGSKLALGVARAVGEPGATPVAVVYGELALDAYIGPIDGLDIGHGLVELRSGGTVLAASGNEGLRKVAVPMAVPNSPFVVAAASGDGQAMFGAEVELGIGVLLLLAAAVVLWRLRRGARMHTVGGSDEPTLAQAISAIAANKSATTGDVEPAKPAKVALAQPAVGVDRSIFRAYDIRGVLGKTLDVHVARLIGRAVGSLVREKGLREIVVGRDGRLSGPQLSAALIEGLRATGCDVIDIGQAATPVVYFASFQLHAGSCIAVTGSHNPPDYNGFKIVVGGDTLSGDAIQDLYSRIAENNLLDGESGGLQSTDVSRDYLERIASDIQLERRMRVVVDCGNGVAGAIAPDVLEAIGCHAEALYCDVDGHFPNHHPDPSAPENLRDLITAVQRTGAELGLAFDGDGDRLGVVTASGRIIYPDRVLMLFAQDVLSRNPGAAVIYDVKCSGHLAGQILRHGGSPIMWKTGHSLIKAKMKETDAELAGEMSGHFFFRERWFGFDDGIYAAARLLEILAADERDPEAVFAELPEGVSTPEIKVPMVEGEHYAFVDKFREKARFDGAKIFTIDGVRADWPDGWGLLRCSNTTPSLVMRFEADNEPALKRIQATFRAQIEAVQPGLKLPI